jgi:hypothetical protein
VSDVLVPAERRAAGWPTAVALVLLAWAAGVPVAYLLILLTVTVWHLALPVLLAGWTVVSVLLTIRVRTRARGAGREEVDGGRAAFGTLRQRSALLMNTALLVTGPIAAVVILVGGTGFSAGSGAQPGLIALVVWGFVLLAATVPAAVLNGLWSLDPATAAHERAVLRRTEQGTRGVVRLARVVAWITWIGYGVLALLVLVAALHGAF